ncbi:hypothetical protein CC80DRAFT_555745 [Byssothecium circinans]|uniref:Uncharacterized protein n=1 Tax=Byssothecium circinans TaxID=147558 RepID=A0A6A5TE43_9PLEO|nr:hypothetical protein CC80DRAFT_555745 [Byssothecium circinans]
MPHMTRAPSATSELRQGSPANVKGASLDALPAELLLHVIAYCDDKDNRGRRCQSSKVDLYSLCLTSKTFNRLATPQLYAEYTSDECYFSYVSTIVERPELTRALKTLRWRLSHSSTDYARSNPYFSSKLREHLHPFIDDPLKVGDAYLVAALRAPNLQHLNISGRLVQATHISSGWLEMFQHHSQHHSQHLFGNLQNLWLKRILHKLADLEHVLVPSLRSLTVVDLEDDLYGSWTLQPSSLQLQKLAFKNCKLDARNTTMLIASAQQLKAFEYIGTPDSYCLSTLLRIKPALDRHASSLQIINISWFARDPDMELDAGFDFTSYERLESLRIPSLVPLYAPHVTRNLPPALKILRLTFCRPELLWKTLFEQTEKFRNLEKICIAFSMKRYFRSKEWIPLRAGFAREGIAMDLEAP